MTVVHDEFSELDEFSKILITQWRLSAEDVERIKQAMHVMRLGFTEAALLIGLVTQENLDATTAWVRSHGARRSLVETVGRREEAKRSIAIRQAGEVKPGIQLVLARDPDNPRCERLRALRTELLLLLGASRLQADANVIALLSPCAQEGRSQLSAELAIAFAQLGRRTLLVDADLRRPSQHVLFGSDNKWGLAPCLTFGEPLPLLSVEGLPHLSLLTSGPAASNPLELLSDGRFDRLMTQWRNSFNFVVIDTPPVSQYSDGLAIATLAGEVLVLSRADRTPASDMKAMMRRLASTQSRILGAVLNKIT